MTNDYVGREKQIIYIYITNNGLVWPLKWKLLRDEILAVSIHMCTQSLVYLLKIYIEI